MVMDYWIQQGGTHSGMQFLSWKREGDCWLSTPELRLQQRTSIWEIFSQLAKQPTKKPMNNQIKQPNKKTPQVSLGGYFLDRNE